MRHENSKELEAAVTEIKNDTPVHLDPSWQWANTYQSVSYLGNAVSKLQQAMYGEVSVTRLRCVLGAVIWLAEEALQRLPGE